MCIATETKRHRQTLEPIDSTIAKGPPPTSYWELDLRDQDRAEFYSGFSGDIKGIFISTYDFKPIGTPVALKLNLDTRHRVAVRGTVEWIRELNALVPETVPGMGVRFGAMDRSTQTLIKRHTQNRQTLFYEGAVVSKVGETPPAVDNCPSVIESLHNAARPYGEVPFFSGLLRDVLSLLEDGEREAPASSAVELPTEKTGRNRSSTRLKFPEPIARMTLCATVLDASPRPESFHGGFKDSDNGFRVFLVTKTDIPIGSRVAMRLRHPDGWHIKGSGEVLWRRKHNPTLPGHLAPPGVGICLTDVTPSLWRNAFPGYSDTGTPILCEAC